MKISQKRHVTKTGVVKRNPRTSFNELSFVRHVVSEAAYKADKWLPDDPDLISDFFNSDFEEQKEFVNSEIDSFFEGRFTKEKEYAAISKYRKQIVESVVKKLTR